MRTFSVGFYKRLFLAILALVILLPMILAIWFGLRCVGLEKDLAEARQIVADLEGAAEVEHTVRPEPATLEGEPINYQTLYPDLYGTAQLPEQRVRSENTVYLTFDGSPTASTEEIMDVLDQYGIRGTFFVVGRTDAESLRIMREIVNRGHAIGIRSYSDSLQKIYQSVEAYLADFEKAYQLIYETTGIRAEIFRFPTGSINAYNSGIYQELIAEMLRRNFIFFDWNVTADDTGAHATAEGVEQTVLDSMTDKTRGIVLFHDSLGQQVVAEALPGIIEGLTEQGYGFQPLTADVMPVVFSYNSVS